MRFESCDETVTLNTFSQVLDAGQTLQPLAEATNLPSKAFAFQEPKLH